MPVKYCSEFGCQYFKYPLPADCSQCPNCGTTDLRLKIDREAFPCSSCGEINTDPTSVCWYCETQLDYTTRSISVD